MGLIKKYLGIVWMIIGPIALIMLIRQVIKIIDTVDKKIAAAPTATLKELAKTDKMNTMLQWGIMISVFIPIVIGFMIFGKYVLQNEYEKDNIVDSNIP